MIKPINGIWPQVGQGVFIAEGAQVIGNVVIGDGASIWYNAVIRADTTPIHIGAGTNIQDNCTVHVDSDAPCTIGDGCTIGHNAVVHGCTIENNVLIGMHATVLSHAIIRENAVIGAGTLISEHKEVPAGSLFIGVPGKLVRALSEQEKDGIRHSAAHYQSMAGKHQENKA